jgi:hypothetical protein
MNRFCFAQHDPAELFDHSDLRMGSHLHGAVLSGVEIVTMDSWAAGWSDFVTAGFMHGMHIVTARAGLTSGRYLTFD